MKKRILALVLSAFMLVSNVQTAFAGTHTQATYIPLGSSSIEPATPELPEQPGGGNGSELSGEPSESDDDTEPPPESDSGVEEGSELPEELPEVEDFIDDEEPKSIEFDGFLLEDLGWSPWEENTIDDFYGAKVTVHPITEGLLDPAEVGYAPFIARTSSQVPMIRAAAGTKTQAKDLAKGDEIYLPVDGQQLSHKVMQTNYTGYNPNGTGTTALGIVIRPTQSPAMFDIEYDYTTIEALIRYDTSFERDWMESVWYNSIDASVRKYLKTPRLPIEHTYWESSGLNSSSPVSYNDNEYDYKVITTDHVFVPSYTEVTGQTGNTQVGRGWNSVSVYADWDGLQNTFFYLRNDRIHHYDISRVATTGDKQNDRVMRGGYATVSVDSSGTATMHTADRNVSNGGKTGSVEGSIGIVYGANSRNYGKAGYPSEQMVSTYIVPHYWIDPATPFAGNDFRENEPPTAPGAISGPGSVNAWDTSTITWTWGAATDPDGDTITYYVERNTGSGWSQVTTTNNTSYTYTIAAGVSSAQIRVRAYDGSEYSGYTTGTATTIVRDTTAPKITTIVSPAAGSYTKDNVQLSIVVEDSQSGPDYIMVDGTRYNGATATVSVTSNKTVAIEAYDKAGNKTTKNEVITQIDREGPVTTWNPSTQEITGGSVVVTVKATDAKAGVSYIENVTTGDRHYGDSWDIVFTSAQEVVLRAVDILGNIGPEVTVRVLNIDNQPPIVSYIITPREATAGTVDIVWTMVDTGSGPGFWEIPGSGEKHYGATYTQTVDSNGNYKIYAFDAVGNKAEETAPVNNIVKEPPAVTITVDKDGAYHNSSSAIVTVVATDAVAGIEKIILPDGSEVNAAKATFEITQNGKYTFEVVNKAGLSTTENLDYQWFDRSAPRLTNLYFVQTGRELDKRAMFGVLAALADNLFNQQVRMIFDYTDKPEDASSNEAESGVSHLTLQVFDSNGIPQNNKRTYQADNLDAIPDLDYELNGYVEIELFDYAGNSSSIIRENIVLDGTGPEITVTQDTNDPVSSFVTLHIRATDTRSGVEYMLVDGVRYEGGIADIEVSANKTVEIKAFDNAGNMSAHSHTVENIDTEAPEVTHSQDITGPTNQPVQVTFTGTDAGSGFSHFIVNGETKQGSTYVHTFTANGSLQVTGYDHAGNPTPYTATVDNIDRTAPQLLSLRFRKTGVSVIKRAAAALFGSNETEYSNQQLELIFQYADTPEGADAESGVKSISYQVFDSDGSPRNNKQIYDVNDLNSIPTLIEEMDVYLEIMVTDHAGNTSEPYHYPVVLDNTKPYMTVEFDLPTWTDQNVTATIKGFDGLAGFSYFENLDTGEIQQGDTITHLFTDNDTARYRGFDRAGNYDDITITVDWIYRELASFDVTYSMEDYTRWPIITTVVASDPVVGIQTIKNLTTGETVQGDTITHTFTVNGTAEFEAVTVAGTPNRITASTDWLDLTPPQLLSVELEKTGEPLERISGAAFSILGNLVSNEQVRLVVTAADTPEGNDAESGVKTYTYRLLMDGETPSEWVTVPYGQKAKLPITKDSSGNLQVYVTDGVGLHSFQTRQDALDGKEGNPDTDIDDGEGTYPVIFETVPPVITWTYSTEDYTNRPVIVFATGEDEAGGSGWSHFTHENQSYYDEEHQINYRENGTEILTGHDRAGNETTEAITVTNIDLTPPSIDRLTYQVTDNDTVIFRVWGSDTPMGIDAESGVYNLVYRWYESQPNGKGIAISPVNIVPYADGVATEPVPYRNNIYVRAYLVDHAGNRSDQTRDDILNGREPGDLEDEDDGNGGGTIYPPVYDLTPPVMEYQLEPDGLTNRPVTANVTAEDLESGVDYLTAHGQRYPGNTLSLDFTENGAVPVNGYNNAGVGDTLNVVVGNIDLTPPVVHSAALKRANLGLVSGLARLFDGRNENAAKVAVNLVIDATDTPMGIDAESGVAAILYRIYNAETKQATSDTIRVPVEELANHIAYIGFNEYIRVLVDDGVGNRSNQTRDDILDGKNPGGLEDKDDGDDNGGIVMPAQLDETAPELAYTLNTTAPTQGNVIATIQGQDLESGFDRIEVLETGEMFYTNTLEYTFTVNKTLTFRGYDKAGNYADLAVTVANIDREGPEITITSNAKERRKTSDPVVLSITARDSSGITGITLPDGTVVKGNNTEYEVKENGTYVIAAEDLAGNTSMKTIEVNEITKPAGNGGGKGSGGGSAGGGRDYVVPPTIELPQGNDGVSQGSSNQDENQDWNTIPDHNYGNANDNPLTGADPRLRDPEEQELIRFLSVKLATHEDYIKIPHKYFNHMDKNATLLDKGDYVVPLLRDALYLTREADEFDEERTTFRDSEDELITILYFKHSDEKWQALQEEYSVAAKQAIEGMELGTAEECVWQIAEWIGQNITYDHSAVLADLLSIASTMQGLVVNNGAYAEKGVWRQGQAVCLGISKAAARMLQQSGLENQLVIGYHNGTPHAWSAVEIDGEWVWVDFTRCVGDTTGTATPFLSEEDLLRYTEKITA